MNSDRMARHAVNFGEGHSRELALAGPGTYTEAQCGECPHGHRCCDLIVGISPFEALGILHWLRNRHSQEEFQAIMGLVKMRADALADFMSNYADDAGGIGGAEYTQACEDWYARQIKCVFYDKQKKCCSIYEVRPLACRKAFGEGDCLNASGIKTAAVHPHAEEYRLTRVKITKGPPQEQQREMTALLHYLAGGAPLGMSEAERAMLETEPELVPPEKRLWGPDGPPVQSPNLLGA